MNKLSSPFIVAIAMVLIFGAARQARAFSCTAGQRGIDSFSCEGTSTENICGNAPNFYCYTNRSEPSPGPHQSFNCATCAFACAGDFVDCNSDPGCETENKIGDACSTGGRSGTLTGNSCSPTCSIPAEAVAGNFVTRQSSEPGNIETGFIRIQGNITTTNGDLFLNSGKAIRIDGSGITELNIGNWGSGSAGVRINILGALAVQQICLNNNCINSWPTGGGGGGGGVTDHGALTGLTDNDHPQYYLQTGDTRDLSVGRDLTVGRNLSIGGILSAGTVPWARLSGFPAACLAGEFVRAVGGTLTCATPPTSSGGLSGGIANKIAFWTGANTLGQNTNLHFDTGTSRMGIGTVAPAERLEIRDDEGDNPAIGGEQGVARLRITDVTNADRQNPGLQIQYGAGDNDHWEMYYDRATTSLRFWQGENRLILTNNGNLTVSGCFGPVVRGMTSSAFNGNLGSATNNGYKEADALCGSVESGSHQCSTGEVLNSIHCGWIWTDGAKTNLKPFIPSSVFAWIANGAPSLPTPTNDCYGWTRTDVIDGQQSQGIAWWFDTKGGGGYARSCNESNRILCCK